MKPRFLFFALSSVLLLMSCHSSKQVMEGVRIEKFPEAWAGEWEGPLEIFNAKGKTMEIYMGLDILPIDSSTYTWTIIYGEGENRQERKYEIKKGSEGEGHYIVDEKNSILLDDYLLGNTLYSRFEVMGSLLLISYEKLGETIIFEVISGKNDDLKTTGGQDSIPEVKSYPIKISQKAILKRKGS